MSAQRRPVRVTTLLAVGVALATVALMAPVSARAASAPAAPAQAAPGQAAAARVAPKPALTVKAYVRIAPTRVETGKRIVLTARTNPAARGFRVQVQRSWNNGRKWAVERTIVTNTKGLATATVSTTRVGASLIRLVVPRNAKYRAYATKPVRVTIEAWKPVPSAPAVPTAPALAPNHKTVSPAVVRHGAPVGLSQRGHPEHPAVGHRHHLGQGRDI